MPRIDLTGMEFGKLRVSEYAGRDRHGHTLWRCQCACGNETVVPAWRLRSQKTKTCREKSCTLPCSAYGQPLLQRVLRVSQQHPARRRVELYEPKKLPGLQDGKGRRGGS